MDDSTFDELFSDKLREEQEFDYREEDWTELSDRLDNKPKRKWGWLFFAAGLFMAASIALNIWQAWNLQNVQKEISTLQKDVSEYNKTIRSLNLKNERQLSEQILATEQISTQRDTIYKTIYQTIIQEKEVPVYIYPENNQRPKSGLSPNSTINNPPLEEASKSLLSNPPAKATKDLASQNFLSQITSAPLLPLTAMDRPLTFSFPELTEETEDKIIQPAFKKKWRLGPSIAYSRVPNNCVDQRNQHLGLDLKVDLSKRWTLENSYSYNRIRNTCLIDQPVDTSALFLPSTNQLIERADLGYGTSNVRNIRSDQRYLQVSLGAKHHFSKHFYVGAHVLGYYLLQRKVSINAPLNNYNNDLFASPLQEAETELENFDLTSDKFFGGRPQSFDPLDENATVNQRPGLIIDRLEITAGKTFNIKNKYQVPVELFYQRNLNVAAFSLPPLVGVRASFLFKL